MKRVLGKLFRRKGNLRNEQTNTGVVSEAVTPGESSTISKRRFILLRWHKLALLALVFVLALMITGAVAVFLQTREPAPTFTTLPTEEQYYNDKVDKLLASPPKETDTAKVKARYYFDLSHAYAELKKYPEAITAFKQGEAVDATSLTYFEYIDLARYYHEIGNKEQAVAALDKALTIMPADDPVIGYSKEAHAASIRAMREEFAR